MEFELTVRFSMCHISGLFLDYASGGKIAGLIRSDGPYLDLAFRLNCEHHRRINDCLLKAGIRLPREAVNDFARNVETSINAFRMQRHDFSVASRRSHEALRKLFLLSIEDDPPIGQIRSHICALPKICIEYLQMRASQVIPGMVEAGGEQLLSWAKDADAKNLVEMIRAICGEGAKRVSRSRGRGKRSGPRLEPLVFGQARGASSGALKGGRPRQYGRDDLVMHLAIDWRIATDAEPSPSRSDHTGFGDLVHSVFQWLDEPTPDQALRRYWKAVEECRSHPARENTLPSS
jgi:hypothetical protein